MITVQSVEISDTKFLKLLFKGKDVNLGTTTSIGETLLLRKKVKALKAETEELGEVIDYLRNREDYLLDVIEHQHKVLDNLGEL